ncbi:MAG: endonuclease domain-containing protein [Candidatus Aminicenantes bacterium]|nr:endonuclease domain-containing protein [Candidatus Aminicenantes bacterium]
MRLSSEEMKSGAIEAARELRKKITFAEKKFWYHVRNRKFLGLKFRRQHPIEFEYNGQKRFFVADFFCPEKNLIVEIDGGIHIYQKKYDELRTLIINELRIEIIRFSNEDVLGNFEKVRKDLTLRLHPDMNKDNGVTDCPLLGGEGKKSCPSPVRRRGWGMRLENQINNKE